MTRQLTAVFGFGLGLGLALALSGPAFAQVATEPAGAEKCMGGGDGAKCGGAAGANAEQELDLRVQFDKDSAKGEIKCKKGKLLKGKVKFEKCVQDKLDGYDEVVIKKKIIEKDKYAKLEPRKKKLAKKLAFYHSACKELKNKLEEMGENKKDDIEYKKTEGALNKIDKEFDKSLAECAKEDKAEFNCPAKDLAVLLNPRRISRAAAAAART
ncbi:MAG: hypothetical protein NDJ72_12145 [Elusimicrobia bacterium]|nr:hypothetical protein [Elusimicrobiota bacterium]